MSTSSERHHLYKTTEDPVREAPVLLSDGARRKTRRGAPRGGLSRDPFAPPRYSAGRLVGPPASVKLLRMLRSWLCAWSWRALLGRHAPHPIEQADAGRPLLFSDDAGSTSQLQGLLVSITVGDVHVDVCVMP